MTRPQLPGTSAKTIAYHSDALWISAPANDGTTREHSPGQAIARDDLVSTSEESSTEVHVRCDFEKLIEYLERRMGTDGELEVLEHLEKCEVCFDTICELVRERAAFRALHSCGEMQIAAMKRAGMRQVDSGKAGSFDPHARSALDRQRDQILSAAGCAAGSRTCIKTRRRRTIWG